MSDLTCEVIHWWICSGSLFGPLCIQRNNSKNVVKSAAWIYKNPDRNTLRWCHSNDFYWFDRAGSLSLRAPRLESDCEPLVKIICNVDLILVLLHYFLRYIVYSVLKTNFCTTCSKTTQVETLYTWNVV